MRQLFVWKVNRLDLQTQSCHTLSLFLRKEDAEAECEWQRKRATKTEYYYVGVIRVYRSSENVHP